MANLTYNIDEIVFLLFNTFSGFFFHFEACMIYCFHALFVFYLALNVLIVVYAAGVCLSKVKVKYYLFFFVNHIYNWINSILYC